MAGQSRGREEGAGVGEGRAWACAALSPRSKVPGPQAANPSTFYHAKPGCPFIAATLTMTR